MKAAPPKRKVRKAGRARKKVRVKGELDISKIELPTERRHVSKRIEDYSTLFYGEYKIGKTTFFSTFPDAMFLTGEAGVSGLDIFEFNWEHGGITSWPVAQRALTVLEKSDRFGTIIGDTADELYRKCQDWVCEMRGVKHPHDAEDFGATWNAVYSEFVSFFQRIKDTGRAVHFTSHIRTGQVKDSKGQKYDRVAPTLSGQQEKAVLAVVDFIFYGQYVRQPDDTQRRVIITEGSDTVTAGQRKIAGGEVKLPPAILLPLNEEQDYEVYKAAFEGRYEGASTGDLIPSRKSSKGQADHLARVRMRAARKEG
jgi:hypothetical protein